MAMYRQRPQLVEAVQWLGGPVFDEATSFSERLPWIKEAWEQGRLTVGVHGFLNLNDDDGITVENTDAVGDWLVRLPDGSLTLYSPEDFEARFERHGVIG